MASRFGGQVILAPRLRPMLFTDKTILILGMHETLTCAPSWTIPASSGVAIIESGPTVQDGMLRAVRFL
jgi:hypothetical protein